MQWQEKAHPSASLWSASSGSESGIKSVDVDTQIHRIGRADSILDLLDDAFGTNLIDLASFNNLETAVTIVLVVGRSG